MELKLHLQVLTFFFCKDLLSIAVQAGAASLAVGDKAPDFEVITLAGETFKLSDYAGEKPVYLKFWATWCSPCKRELNNINDVFGTRDVVVARELTKKFEEIIRGTSETLKDLELLKGEMVLIVAGKSGDRHAYRAGDAPAGRYVRSAQELRQRAQ